GRGLVGRAAVGIVVRRRCPRRGRRLQGYASTLGGDRTLFQGPPGRYGLGRHRPVQHGGDVCRPLPFCQEGEQASAFDTGSLDQVTPKPRPATYYNRRKIRLTRLHLPLTKQTTL